MHRLWLPVLYNDPTKWHRSGDLLDQVTSGVITDAVVSALKTYMRNEPQRLAKIAYARRYVTRQGPFIQACMPIQFSATKPCVPANGALGPVNARYIIRWLAPATSRY